MARKLRVQYQGAIYHVMSRGNGKAAIFRNDVDRRSFLQTLAEACGTRLSGIFSVGATRRYLWMAVAMDI